VEVLRVELVIQEAKAYLVQRDTDILVETEKQMVLVFVTVAEAVAPVAQELWRRNLEILGGLFPEEDFILPAE
jgi:hypothetical protein